MLSFSLSFAVGSSVTTILKTDLFSRMVGRLILRKTVLKISCCVLKISWEYLMTNLMKIYFLRIFIRRPLYRSLKNF